MSSPCVAPRLSRGTNATIKKKMKGLKSGQRDRDWGKKINFRKKNLGNTLWFYMAEKGTENTKKKQTHPKKHCQKAGTQREPRKGQD